MDCKRSPPPGRRPQKDPPGLKVTTRTHAVGGWWITNPEGPAFEAASKALTAGYGVPSTFIGCGGSIPFVEPFSTVLGGIPALLLGLEDPVCNAHSENESLHLGDFEKAVAATVHLYAELAAVGPAALRGGKKAPERHPDSARASPARRDRVLAELRAGTSRSRSLTRCAALGHGATW